MATTSTTTTTTIPSGPRNPRDSMKSTWREASKWQWNVFHWSYELLGLHQSSLSKKAPVHQKSEKIPTVIEWHLHRWVIYHAAIPLIIHQAYMWYFQTQLGPLPTIAYYSIAFNLIGIHQMNSLRQLGQIHGYLDGDKHERDGVPDHSVMGILVALFSTVTLRCALAVFLAYDPSVPPSGLSWICLPVEIGLYGIILDFWFYWYHRVMHQYETLWQYHRTHHLTKHPNALLTLYADHEQEIFDIVGIPLMAYLSLKALGFPMSFYEWWICHQYLVFAELSGHSGLRLHVQPPSTMSWLLAYFNTELVIEDHDLHHRKGWKKSHNYGKQTRLWDRVFGTLGDRIESASDNIDYNKKVSWPVY